MCRKTGDVLEPANVEEAIYNSQSIHRFVGNDLPREAAADAVTLLKFRRLLKGQVRRRLLTIDAGVLKRESEFTSQKLRKGRCSRKRPLKVRTIRHSDGEELEQRYLFNVSSKPDLHTICSLRPLYIDFDVPPFSVAQGFRVRG